MKNQNNKMANEIIAEKIHKEFNRDTFWTRILFKSEEGKESVVLVCASHEYLFNMTGKHDFADSDLQKWVEQVIQKWDGQSDIFRKKVHYDVYALSEEGQLNGLRFLQEEVKP